MPTLEKESKKRGSKSRKMADPEREGGGIVFFQLGGAKAWFKLRLRSGQAKGKNRCSKKVTEVES